MLKVKNIEVFNFEGALRGMRNPMNSWDKGDTRVIIGDLGYEEENSVFSPNCLQPIVGPNDLKLAQTLIRGGAEECKFLRQIQVSMDISAPRFWWTEMDTYKVGTTANSCSTMHRLTKAPITANDFAFEESNSPKIEWIQGHLITQCEELRQLYVRTKDKKYWRALIETLPNAYIQKRTWTANYQVLRNIYFQRQGHKLKEWHEFLDVVDKLPYAEEFISYGARR